MQEALRSDATDEEIARLMDELRQATRDYMQEMARRAIENGEMQQAEIPPGQTMTQDQIQELMDRIQELSEQGRRAEAEALLEMLQQMLENMQMMMGQSGQQGEGQGGQGQQSMQGLADALREQQGLADEAFRRLQEEFRRGRGDPGQGSEGGQPGDDPSGGDPRSLAERQEALRQLMEELQDGLPGAAGEAAREALRDAERNMGEARDDLEGGETADALDRQADAIDQLREGMREMGEDLRRAENAQGGSEQGQVAGDDHLGNRARPARPADRLARQRRQQREHRPRGRQRRTRPRAARRDPPALGRPGPSATRARLPAPAARLVLTGLPRTPQAAPGGADLRRLGGGGGFHRTCISGPLRSSHKLR